MWGAAFKSLLEGISNNQCTHLTLTVGGGDFSRGPKNPKPASTWKGHTDIVWALTVLPDGSVVSGSHDKTLRRWESVSHVLTMLQCMVMEALTSNASVTSLSLSMTQGTVLAIGLEHLSGGLHLN